MTEQKPETTNARRGRLPLFVRILAVAWILYFVVIALLFLFPSKLFRVVDALFGHELWPVGYALPVLVALSMAYSFGWVLREVVRAASKR